MLKYLAMVKRYDIDNFVNNLSRACGEVPKPHLAVARIVPISELLTRRNYHKKK